MENFAGHFTKHGLLRQHRPNSVAHIGLPFLSKLNYILFRNFSYWRLALCWVSLF